jgi:hypothetical protein
MTRIYASLLRLYPECYKSRFGGEMPVIFEQAAEDHRKRGAIAYSWFVAREVVSLAIGAGLEWLAKLTRSSGYCLPAAAATATSHLPAEIAEAEIRVKQVLRRMEYAIAHHQFQKARLYSDEERIERERLRLVREKYRIAE